ncbi:MAG: hypothetical protein ACOVP4_04800 [Bacteriovoracaceae bacterium]
MSKIDLKTITPDELKDLILEGLNPNTYLKDAVSLNRVDLVRAMFDYGATTSTLFGPSTRDQFLNNCPDGVARYISLFNERSNREAIEMCFNEVSSCLYDIDYSSCTNRSYQFTNEAKISHWSFGLTEREANDPIYIEMALELCDIGDWDDRFSNVNPNELNGFYLISTVRDLGYSRMAVDDLSDVIDPEYISPNISFTFNIYLVSSYELKPFLGKLTFEGFSEIVGISHVGDSKLFKTDGSIDFSIFDNMKTTVSGQQRKRGN